jgi:hypothetical protein
LRQAGDGEENNAQCGQKTGSDNLPEVHMNDYIANRKRLVIF